MTSDKLQAAPALRCAVSQPLLVARVQTLNPRVGVCKLALMYCAGIADSCACKGLGTPADCRQRLMAVTPRPGQIPQALINRRGWTHTTSTVQGGRAVQHPEIHGITAANMARIISASPWIVCLYSASCAGAAGTPVCSKTFPG